MDRLLVFDGDCGFCTTSVRLLQRWLRRPPPVTAWQRTELAALGLTPAECAAAVRYRSGGQWYAGGAAVTRLLRDDRAPWSVLGAAGSLVGVRVLVDLLYRWVAAHRYQLPGGTPACRVEDRAA